MSLYEGKDINLKEEPYCFACQYYDDRSVVSELKRCSRCHAAWYCSAQCQKRHFQEHRSLCKRIGGETNIVDLMAYPLQHIPMDDTVINLFETHVGELGAIDVAKDYLDALSSLANSCWNSAYEWEVKEVWEKSLSHYLELLRLDVGHRCETRFRVPFILLYLNRDDDAYCFMRYWINFGVEDDDTILARHASSRQGDWLYPVEPNCRYNDVAEESSSKLEETQYTLPHLVALAIIKMRIVAMGNAISQTLDFTFQETACKQIQEVRPIVQEVLAGFDINSQHQQLDRILDLIYHGEPSLLSTILESVHISETRRPVELIDALNGHNVSLKDFILLNGLRLFLRVPGAVDILRQRG
ncbi:hypothetical protein FisN_28Lh054 [Fistulifera solaris]|jgi:hypothetical protein|uniref:MYND-type domain-containing protein n=1 Tax=Fistulifera solaris TaxID=1519565 RepID=A0A1Z5KTH8_FISSO|nr:hypothetical protein FisN_28Lh054 [Fistulifera solaris]|eukprot:GAX29228.1 hypothetical protein FisN_28Lh054 [Fistulifera solaris]